MSIAGQEISLPTQEEISEANAPREKSRNKNGLLASTKARITAGVLGISLFSSAFIEACGGGAKDSSPTKTVVPTYPAGVNVVHATETPMPSQTATIADFLTSTAKAEATKTAQPAKTPETTATTKTEVQKGFKVILNPDVVGPFDAGLTTEQFKDKVTQITEQLIPKIEGLDYDIEIFQGNRPGQPNNSSYENNGIRPKIRINSAESMERLAFVIAHEWGHMATDLSILQKRMSPERFQRFQEAIKNAVTDKNWGLLENADPLPVLMTEDMANVNFPIDETTPEGIVRAIAQRYMASTQWAGRTKPPDINNPQAEPKNPFIEQIGFRSEKLAFLKEELQKPEYRQQKIYETLGDFLNDPQISDLITKIATANPALSIGIDKLKEDSHYFTGNLRSILATTPAQVPVLGSTKGESVELIVNAAMYEFAQKIRENDPAAVASLNPSELSTDQEFLTNVLYRSQNEGSADQMACALLRPDLNPPISAAIQILKEN